MKVDWKKTWFCGWGKRKENGSGVEPLGTFGEIKENADSLVDRGNILLGQGLFGEAADLYRQAIQRAPDYFRAHYNLGVALGKADFLAEAAASYEKALALHPEDTEAQCNLGVILRKAGRLEEAAAVYKKGLLLDPENAEIHNNLGVVQKELGLFEEAVVSYEKALSFKPEYLAAYLNQAVVFSKLNRHDKAEASYRKALALDPGNFEAYNNLGVVQKELGLLEEAVSSHLKALALNPGYGGARYNLAKVLLNSGRLKDSAAVFEEVLAARPDFPQALTYQAIIAWIGGEFKLCKEFVGTLERSTRGVSSYDSRFVMPYFLFLQQLLIYHELNRSLYPANQEGMPPIYVFGDSHCLSPANLGVNIRGDEYIVKAKLVIGCKLWHLGNPFQNIFKSSFEIQIGMLPPGALIVVMFGEIDCRPDEGIILHQRKTGLKISKIIRSLVENYLVYLQGVCRGKKISPIVCNVPAQQKRMDVSAETMMMQLDVVRELNQVVAEECLTRGIPLLDVYEVSADSEGRLKAESSLDGVHLLPEIYRELFKGL